jgi:hypothetical protein
VLKRYFKIEYIIALLISIFIGYGVYLKSISDYNQSILLYQEKSKTEAELVRLNIEKTFNEAFQGIRTISFLPNVRSIDRYATNLDDNSKQAILQIYNNLKTNIKVSEVYIVPVDLEPEEIDPNTGSLQIPILMFDGNDSSGISALKNTTSPRITTIDQAIAVRNAPRK